MIETSFLHTALFLVATYLISSIPFGLIISKAIAKKDVRKHGSGNIGATNVTRVIGKKWGAVTLILDGVKGAIMVIIAQFIFSQNQELLLIMTLTGGTAVMGHIFSIYLRFKGGKGVATTLAVIFAINPLAGLINLTSWIAVFALSRTSALASITAITFTACVAMYMDLAREEAVLYLFLAILIIARHKENIARIISNKENKV